MSIIILKGKRQFCIYIIFCFFQSSNIIHSNIYIYSSAQFTKPKFSRLGYVLLSVYPICSVRINSLVHNVNSYAPASKSMFDSTVAGQFLFDATTNCFSSHFLPLHPTLGLAQQQQHIYKRALCSVFFHLNVRCFQQTTKNCVVAWLSSRYRLLSLPVVVAITKKNAIRSR